MRVKPFERIYAFGNSPVAGAQPTDRVLRFLDAAGLAKRAPRSNPERAKPGKKATERVEARAKAAADKAAADAAPAEAPAAE